MDEQSYICPRCDCVLGTLILNRETRRVIAFECNMCGTRTPLRKIDEAK